MVPYRTPRESHPAGTPTRAHNAYGSGQKERTANLAILLVGVRRLELPASWSRTMRATNCATPRYIYDVILSSFFSPKFSLGARTAHMTEGNTLHSLNEPYNCRMSSCSIEVIVLWRTNCATPRYVYDVILSSFPSPKFSLGARTAHMTEGNTLHSLNEPNNH